MLTSTGKTIAGLLKDNDNNSYTIWYQYWKRLEDIAQINYIMRTIFFLNSKKLHGE